jgi:hypothetical protein
MATVFHARMEKPAEPERSCEEWMDGIEKELGALLEETGLHQFETAGVYDRADDKGKRLTFLSEHFYESPCGRLAYSSFTRYPEENLLTTKIILANGSNRLKDDREEKVEGYLRERCRDYDLAINRTGY